MRVAGSQSFTPDDVVGSVDGAIEVEVADRTVPYDQAKRIDATLKKAGVPSYFVTVEGAGHGNFGRAADDRVEAFFGKYLLGKDVEISTKTIEWKP